MIVGKTKCEVKKGVDFLDASFSLSCFNILDHISDSENYKYLVETYNHNKSTVTTPRTTKGFLLMKNVFGANTTLASNV